MEGRMPRHAIRWPEAEVLHRPFDKMDDVGMGNDHAFGNPCRSRGEENMRGIAARRLYVHRGRGASLDLLKGELRFEVVPARRLVCGPPHANGVPEPVL